MIPSELLNRLLPNLAWCWMIMSQIVLQKDWFAVFKIKVTAKGHIIKIWLCDMSFELLILLQLNLVWRHIITRWNVLWKDWIALFWSRSRSQKRFRILMNVHLDDHSAAAESSVTKLGNGHATLWAKVSCKKIGLLSWHSGSQWGLIWSNVTVSTISAELLISWQPIFFWMVYHHKLECFV